MEFILWLMVISAGILGLTCLETVPICKTQNETNEHLCCPGPSSSCPYNYQLVDKDVVCAKTNDTEVTTSPSTETTPKLSTTITPDVPANDTNTTNPLATSPDSNDEKFTTVPVCEKCKKYDHFNNETRKCENCDKKCLSCVWEDKENCTVCFIEHDGTCLASCPSGTGRSSRKTENGSWLCDEKEDKAVPIAIIGGAAAGGVIIIVIVIVIICVCCRRRNQALLPGNDRRAMSIILEGNDNTSYTPETESKPTTHRRKNYENMNTKLPGHDDITQQAESLGRYTRDPTIDRRKGVSKGNESDYANHMMVRIAQQTDITGADAGRLESLVEKEELRDLGEAPTAPGIPVPTSVKPSKPSLVKRLSQRITKTKKGKSKEAAPEAAELEEYVDMSQSEVQPVLSQDDGLEDYENIKFSGVPKGRKAKPPADLTIAQQEAGMELYENYNQPAEGASLDDLDDYENTANLSKTGTGGGADDDMEDYENMKDLEPYENFNFNQAKGRKAKQ